MEKTKQTLNVDFFFENRAVYEITWKNIVPERPQMTTWRMRIAYWIPKATNTLSECVIKRKGKVTPKQAYVFCFGAPGFLDNRHNKVVRFQPYAPTVFTPRNILVLISKGWVDPGHMNLSDASEKIPSDTTGNRSGDLRLVAQRLNHYAAPGP
jgi:hypothetical protein